MVLTVVRIDIYFPHIIFVGDFGAGLFVFQKLHRVDPHVLVVAGQFFLFELHYHRQSE